MVGISAHFEVIFLSQFGLNGGFSGRSSLGSLDCCLSACIHGCPLFVGSLMVAHLRGLSSNRIFLEIDDCFNDLLTINVDFVARNGLLEVLFRGVTLWSFRERRSGWTDWKGGNR